MICPKCRHTQADGLAECLKCGVVFAKLRAAAPPAGTGSVPPQAQADTPSPGSAWRELFLPEPRHANPVLIGGRLLLWLVLILWGATFIFASVASNTTGQSFLHLVNLPFHEAGHIIFSPFGQMLHVLGGTLGQLLMPAVCAAVLLLQTRDPFGAAAALWWLAENFMDIAPYINDARALDLMLLGGVTGKDVPDYHDWQFILGRLGLLRWDHALAGIAQCTGIVLMLAALAWAAACLWMQIRAWRSDASAA